LTVGYIFFRRWFLIGSASWIWRFFDLEALRREGFGDVAGGLRSRTSGSFSPVLRANFYRHAVQQLGLLVRGIHFGGGFFLASEVRIRSRACMLPEVASIPILRGSRKLARVARLDGDHISAVPEIIDIFLQNNLHMGFPFQSNRNAVKSLSSTATRSCLFPGDKTAGEKPPGKKLRLAGCAGGCGCRRSAR